MVIKRGKLGGRQDLTAESYKKNKEGTKLNYNKPS